MTDILTQTNEKLNQIFNDRSLTAEQRGELGEDLIADLIKYWCTDLNYSLVRRSFIFPQGPVLKNTRSLEGDNPVTEIDLLLVTDYRIFVIEIKTVYGHMRVHPSSNIEVSRDATFGQGDLEKKNYFQQNEMHARHLYYHLHKLIPKGDPRYIIPLLVLGGKMQVEDFRDDYSRSKYPMTNISGLLNMLTKLNEPFDYLLNVKSIEKKLKSILVNDKERLLRSQTFA